MTIMARVKSSPAPAAMVTGIREIANIIATLALVLQRNARTRAKTTPSFSPKDMNPDPDGVTTLHHPSIGAELPFQSGSVVRPSLSMRAETPSK
ncbi:MAG TPA: hypothetical protein VII56_23860 [Rhizomicrobium sp.]